MTGRDLSLLHSRYLAICKLFCQVPDRTWLLMEFASDERYQRINILAELQGFHEYWSDRPSRPKSHKRALRNWFAKEVEARAVGAVAGGFWGRNSVAEDAIAGHKAKAEAFSALVEEIRATATWSDVARRLGQETDPHAFNTWLRPTAGRGYDEQGALVVAVPNEVFRDWCQDHYAARASELAGVSVKFCVG